jgi:hypothetical protein
MACACTPDIVAGAGAPVVKSAGVALATGGGTWIPSPEDEVEDEEADEDEQELYPR